MYTVKSERQGSQTTSGFTGCDRESGFHSKLNKLYIKVSSTKRDKNGLFIFTLTLQKINLETIFK